MDSQSASEGLDVTTALDAGEIGGDLMFFIGG